MKGQKLACYQDEAARLMIHSLYSNEIFHRGISGAAADSCVSPDNSAWG